MSEVITRHWADKPVAGMLPAAVITLRRVDASADLPCCWRVTLDSAFTPDISLEVIGTYVTRTEAEGAVAVCLDPALRDVPVMPLPPRATWGDKDARSIIRACTSPPQPTIIGDN